MKYPFSENELLNKKKHEFRGHEFYIYDYPCTAAEAARSALNGAPVWQISGAEISYFAPRVIPDSIARAFVIDGGEPIEKIGGKDMFGIEWKYIPQARGSMVIPGNPLMKNANDWKRLVKFPDLDSWDFRLDYEKNKEFLKNKMNLVFFMNGWFERLISFMDFGGASVALVDDDQKAAVKELLMAVTDTYIELFRRLFDVYPEIDGVCGHDDWGSQRAPIFSLETAEEMLVPAMKKFTDYLHKKGKICNLHSCGCNQDLVPAYIDAGWDSWNPQAMNDTEMIYEKYGDRIIVGVMARELPEDASEEEQRAAAREYARRFCDPEKPSTFNMYSRVPEFFREELYRQSRIRYGE